VLENGMISRSLQYEDNQIATTLVYTTLRKTADRMSHIHISKMAANEIRIHTQPEPKTYLRN